MSLNLSICANSLFSPIIIDLYGLVYFLGYRPHYIRQWWHELVWQPYRHGNPRPMIALFSELMWRKSKEDVADEVSEGQA